MSNDNPMTNERINIILPAMYEKGKQHNNLLPGFKLKYEAVKSAELTRQTFSILICFAFDVVPDVNNEIYLESSIQSKIKLPKSTSFFETELIQLDAKVLMFLTLNLDPFNSNFECINLLYGSVIKKNIFNHFLQYQIIFFAN
jgi:hypothetical protein